MDRRRPVILALLLGLGALLLVVAANQKPTCKTCPTCPGGVCPVKYGDVLKTFRAGGEPDIDIPDDWREHNYAGGSCVHATTETLLRWIGQNAMADWWRKTYSGGDNAYDHERKLTDAGLKFVMTTDGDVRLLNWALATRRGAGIGWPTGHCTALVGHIGDEAVVEDNNHPGTYTRLSWDKFIREWRGMGGWAFSLVYDPPPPVPTKR